MAGLGTAALLLTTAGCSTHDNSDPSASATQVGEQVYAKPSAGSKAGSPSAASHSRRPTTASSSPAASTKHHKKKDKSGGPLAGKVVLLDAGHNPGNAHHPAEINKLVDVGTERKACDTAGAETNGGYPEADFTLDVTARVSKLLHAEGAKVVLTHTASSPSWGPCITQRAAIGNKAHADAAISIHADGGPASGLGFQVILPKTVDDSVTDNTAIIKPSHTLGMDVRSAFAKATKEPFATYLGGGRGYTVRSDLGGLNLSKVPKIFIECANMRNATDAARVTSAAWRQKAAQGIADGLTEYLTTR